jgi:hypothetical protein
MIPKSWIRLAAAVVICTAVGAAAMIAARSSRPRCAMDGVLLPTAAVQIETAGGAAHSFCSVKCAESWIAMSRQRPIAIRVADERTGKMVDAADAHYVRSSAFSAMHSRDPRRAFARAPDAQRHVETFRGRVLVGDQAPFPRYRKWKKTAQQRDQS